MFPDSQDVKDALTEVSRRRLEPPANEHKPVSRGSSSPAEVEGAAVPGQL
jgi:hypothetical protein